MKIEEEKINIEKIQKKEKEKKETNPFSTFFL